MNLQHILHGNRSNRRPQVRRRPIVDDLEGRQLLSSLVPEVQKVREAAMVVPEVQKVPEAASAFQGVVGSHIGTYAIQGSHVGTDAIQGSHIGTNGASPDGIVGNHIGTSA
jgi:hypothetical protein